MRWLIETEDGEIREADEFTFNHFARLRMTMYGEAVIRRGHGQGDDRADTLLHPRVDRDEGGTMAGTTLVNRESETGLYVERSHVSHITWVPITGQPDGPLHAGTLTEAKAYIQSLSTKPLHWHEDDISGPTTRWVAWAVG